MNEPSTNAEVRTTRSEAGSAIEAVFETILKDIVTGVYPPGARLPAERELARVLGASRPTLREALRRLAEWRLIDPRRGSGIVVRAISEWSIEVLPAFLRYARPAQGEPALADLLVDLLALRRSLMLEILRVVAGRVPPGGIMKPRAAAARAWAARHDAERFRVEDLDVVRSLVEAAKFMPALWLLNRLASVYLDISRSLPGQLLPPDDYLEVHERMLDALERGDGAQAVAILSDYLERHDAQLCRVLGARP